jgi:hypothetical protein
VFSFFLLLSHFRSEARRCYTSSKNAFLYNTVYQGKSKDQQQSSGSRVHFIKLIRQSKTDTKYHKTKKKHGPSDFVRALVGGSKIA